MFRALFSISDVVCVLVVECSSQNRSVFLRGWSRGRMPLRRTSPSVWQGKRQVLDASYLLKLLT